MDNFLVEIEKEVEIERKALDTKKNNVLQSHKFININIINI